MSSTKNPTSSVELNDVTVGENETKMQEIEYHESLTFMDRLKKKSVPESKLVKAHKVEETMASKELAISKMKLNLANIFHHWDIDRNDYVDLREIQLGLYASGEIVPKDTILYHMKKVSGRKTNVTKCYAREFPDLIVSLSDGSIDGIQDLVIRLSKNIPLKDKDRPTLWLRLMGKGKKRDDSSKVDDEGEEKELKGRTKRSQSTLDRISNIGGTLGLSDNIHFYQPKIMWEMLTFQRGAYAAFFMFLLWQFGFSLFYCLYNKFRFDRAFYYSAQAGLSVGFGALSEEWESGFPLNEDCSANKHYSKPHFDFSKFVTILNVLLGSSVIGGALGFFIDSALEKQSAWFEEEEAKKKHDAKKKELQSKHQSADLAKMWIADFYDSNRTEILLTTGVFLFIVAGVLFGTHCLVFIVPTISHSSILVRTQSNEKKNTHTHRNAARGLDLHFISLLRCYRNEYGWFADTKR